jgi:precorrin-2 dehydrogenase/sirohydrochlorin ferrochelatase
MFPAILDLSKLRVAVAGDGTAVLRRLRMLDEDRAAHVRVFVPRPSPQLALEAGDRLIRRLPTRSEIASVHILFVGGLAEEEARALAEIAREEGALVNVEDVTDLCDFHVPAQVRRGDLLMTVSTGGKSPGLARRLGRQLATQFGPEWEGRLAELGRQRQEWKQDGLDMRRLGEKTDEFLAHRGWLE